MVEQEKKWGSEIVEGSAAKVLTDLSTREKDKSLRLLFFLISGRGWLRF